MSRPLISVVLPTRNRAALLEKAITTLLAQTCDDLEVVVSDNASTDETEAIARGGGDARVRYVRSDRVLTQPDSWEFGVSHAEGEWMTVLGDDDGLVPSCVRRLAALLSTGDRSPVTWGEAWYYDPHFPPTWLEPGEANRLTIDPWSGRLDVTDSETALRDIFAMYPHSPPGLFNAAVHRSTLDRVRDRQGRVFGHPDPFVTSGVAVLLEEPGFRALRMPLTVRGIAEPTLSLNFARNTRDAHEGVREFDSRGLFEMAPLRQRTLANLVAESLLRMKRTRPGALLDHELDAVRYFVTVRQELDDVRRRPDEGAALAEWSDVLAEQPADVRRAVRRKVRHMRTRAVVRTLSRRVPGSVRLHRAICRRTADGGSAFRLVEGDAEGFHDLPSAAKFIDAQILPTG